MLYLHRKAMELGFWNVEDDMTMPAESRNAGVRVPRYKLTYSYKEKSKTVTLDADYSGIQKMKDAAKTTIDEVLQMIATAKAR